MDWSSLPSELLGEIAGRLKMAEDFAAFRGICRTWRAAADTDLFAGVSKVPLLMIQKKDGGLNERQLYSFPSKRTLMTISLPENKRCIDAGFGWMLIQMVTDEVSLFNPISGTQIHLDYFLDLVGFEPRDDYVRAVLSTNPSEDPSDFTLLIITHMVTCCWRAGDETFYRRLTEHLYNGYASIVSYSGKFYFLEWYGDLIVWDPSTGFDDSNFNRLMDMNSDSLDDGKFLVESCDGELLALCPFNDGFQNYPTYFEVIKIDLINNEWRFINDLEKQVLFVGENIINCIDAASAFPDMIKPNCIYFIEDCLCNAPKDIAIKVYSMEGGRWIEEPFNMESIDSVFSPLWIHSSIISKS